MKTLLIFILFIFSMNGYGQDSSIVKPADSNSVFVHKDPRIDSLVKKQAFINEVTSREGRRTDKGFRILIISTNKRDEALSAKSKIYSFFPELKAYLWYQSPYFRVKAGNFKERKDAEAYQRRLNVYFPKGVFIMKDDDVEMKNGKGLN
ncbi:MAG: hypothetical protein ACRDEB_02755, partial [Chitinophagaceae bacterium]